jgi:urocanate hydratase
MKSNRNTVPEWVRTTMCLSAAAGIIILILAASRGVDLGTSIHASTVGYALVALKLAFGNGP